MDRPAPFGSNKSHVGHDRHQHRHPLAWIDIGSSGSRTSHRWLEPIASRYGEPEIIRSIDLSNERLQSAVLPSNDRHDSGTAVTNHSVRLPRVDREFLRSVPCVS